ncbi:MAG: hypothetical protein JWS10_2373 [Cypionkella sp.]|nr:hypothetical protein [Cypionkella sp.]
MKDLCHEGRSRRTLHGSGRACDSQTSVALPTYSPDAADSDIETEEDVEGVDDSEHAAQRQLGLGSNCI